MRFISSLLCVLIACVGFSYGALKTFPTNVPRDVTYGNYFVSITFNDATKLPVYTMSIVDNPQVTAKIISYTSGRIYAQIQGTPSPSRKSIEFSIASRGQGTLIGALVLTSNPNDIVTMEPSFLIGTTDEDRLQDTPVRIKTVNPSAVSVFVSNKNRAPRFASTSEIPCTRIYDFLDCSIPSWATEMTDSVTLHLAPPGATTVKDAFSSFEVEVLQVKKYAAKPSTDPRNLNLRDPTPKVFIVDGLSLPTSFNGVLFARLVSPIAETSQFPVSAWAPVSIIGDEISIDPTTTWWTVETVNQIAFSGVPRVVVQLATKTFGGYTPFRQQEISIPVSPPKY